jgi:exodeoxyribonuclease-1
MSASFVWYDLETWGTDPRTSRIAQFAAQRTDLELNPVGAPVNLLCRAADDLLPSPQASLVTGLAPQDTERDGLIEADFFTRVCEELSQPGTCAVGYNSIRFDDEFLRFGLYRNFYDPYEREWRDGNSRWDLLDFLRLAHALRPEGLEWPKREDGAASFRLEHLAEANGTREGAAHEALSDVNALIGLARKLRAAQPRLWDYALSLRDKRHVAGLVDVAAGPPLLHVSGRYPALRLCSALVLPIAVHPQIQTRVIVIDLDCDPALLADLDAAAIAERLYTPAADLPEGERRVALKEVHTNKCPVLVPMAHLREADFERLGIDRAAAERRAARLRATAGLAEKVRRVFASEAHREPSDADAALYDGFINDADRRQFARIRSSAPAALRGIAANLRDPRCPELLLRYRARNWPESLDAGEREAWNEYRRRRLGRDSGLSEYDFESYRASIASLRAQHEAGPAQALLDALEDWGRQLEADLAD